jgi:hypothetical protein
VVVVVVFFFFFFFLPKPSSHTMAMWSTQPVTEMSTRNVSGCKGQLACKAENVTAICELNVKDCLFPNLF